MTFFNRFSRRSNATEVNINTESCWHSILAKISLFLIVLTILFKILLGIARNLRQGDYYYHYWYNYFRKFWDSISNAYPFPLLFLWMLVLMFMLVIISLNLIKKNFKKVACQSISIVLIHFCYFYLFWGFNYGREPLSKRLNLDTAISDSSFQVEAISVTNNLNDLRSHIALKPNYDIAENQISLLKEIRKEINHVFTTFNLSSIHEPVVRLLRPKGSLLIWGASGVYWPFAGEGHVDSGLDSWQIPFTAAHEMAHVMGWTDEGECNFLAYLACAKAQDINIEYSAELAYWRYLMANANQFDAQLRKTCLELLHPEIKHDIADIDLALDKYPELFEPFRKKFYDFYLKANGVQGGDKSYSNIIIWKINFFNKNKKGSPE